MVSAFAVSFAAVAFAGPGAPAMPMGPAWGVKFPNIAEVSVHAKDGAALGTLCKPPPKVRVAPVKQLTFERPASGDKSIHKLVLEQSSKLKPMDVTVRFIPASESCTLQLKSAVFSHYGVTIGPNQKLPVESFTLAFAQATPAK